VGKDYGRRTNKTKISQSQSSSQSEKEELIEILKALQAKSQEQHHMNQKILGQIRQINHRLDSGKFAQAPAAGKTESEDEIISDVGGLFSSAAK
jgi:hypothetical protein